jgi:uncharacterized protein (TIGR03083 family)
MTLDYLDHLVRESARFAAALRDAPSDARVPSCPDWDADDLLWHLGEVQWFWGEVVERRITEGAEADSLVRDDRPADRAGLEAFYGQASARLAKVLTDTPPATTVWTWSDEQSAGFIRRRQAHEALVHRLDAELTSGSRSPMDPVLCADGIDEGLRIMYGGHPAWSTFTRAEEQTLRLRSTDRGDSWLITLGRLTGTPPDSDPIDETDIDIAATDPGTPAAATVTGTAEDLECWLWHRPTLGEVERSGDPSVLAAFDQMISPGIQ